jgi:hypothetical protein
MLLFAVVVKAQHVTLTPEQIKGYTPEWKGERFPDGRPKVEDKWLERLKKVRLEEGWGILRNKGYQNQFEGDWMVLEPDSAMTGRVVTCPIPSIKTGRRQNNKRHWQDRKTNRRHQLMAH